MDRGPVRGRNFRGRHLRHIVLDGGPDPLHRREEEWGGGIVPVAKYRNIARTFDTAFVRLLWPLVFDSACRTVNLA